MADPIPEEYKHLIATLQQMKVKPKADNPKEFESWIHEFAMERLKPEVKQEPHAVASSSQPIRLNNFSGNKDKKGKETSYELWRYEIMGLLRDKSHTEEAIIQAIRRSVKGDAGLVAMRLGPEASLTEILTKMESVYGNVDETETIMGEFYNARQQEDEDVSEWSCRLEGILDRAVNAGNVSRDQAGSMLHDMLWKGLKPALKDVTHYEKERYSTFDKLRTALRRIEKERQLDHPLKIKATSKQAVVTGEIDQSELSGVLKQINARLQNLESQQQDRYQHRQPYQQQQSSSQQPYQQQQPGLQQQPYQYQQRYDANRDRGRAKEGRFRGRGLGRGYRGYGQQQQQQQPSNFKFPEVICNRCHREGHIAKGCRSNTDVNGKSLN